MTKQTSKKPATKKPAAKKPTPEKSAPKKRVAEKPAPKSLPKATKAMPKEPRIEKPSTDELDALQSKVRADRDDYDAKKFSEYFEEAIAISYDRVEEIIDDAKLDIGSDPDTLERNISSTMTGIHTLLIQETGRYVESYASDLLISIEELDTALKLMGLKKIKDPDYRHKAIYVFALRESGVDHSEYVTSQMKNYRQNPSAFDYYYRKIYAIKVETVDDNGFPAIAIEMKEIRKELGYVLWKICT